MRAFAQSTIDGGLNLSVGSMLRDRMLVPDGKGVKGSIVWNSNGRVMSTIGYQSLLREDGRGVLRLYWVSCCSERTKSDQMISLVSTPQHFGGQRWWFVCPVTGRHVMKLYLPNGARTFASREAYRLPYRCQQETKTDRAIRQRFKLRDQLGVEGVDEYVPKPKWMRWPTFERKREALRTADQRTLAGMMSAALRMRSSLMR